MAYELATSTNLHYDKIGNVPFLKGVERIINAGFKNLDFNFLDMVDYPNRFLDDDYKEWMYECREFAEKHGAKWVQAHAVASGLQKDSEQFMRNVKRSIECCSYLGIKWTVLHHVQNPHYSVGSTLSPREYNLKMFSEFLKTAEKFGVGLAIENTQFPFFAGNAYASATEDLVDLVDALDSPYVGICWDIGHANLNCFFDGAEEIANQSKQLKILGDRLKATHVHDNNCKMAGLNAQIKLDNMGKNPVLAFDEHIQPYMGTIDWDDVISGLDAINYDHYFTYEAHRAINSLPDELVDGGLKQLYDIGKILVNKSSLK